MVESRKHNATNLLRQIPSIGPIRAALLIALIQTPHRFRTKRQLWAYSGLALKTSISGEHRVLQGQLRRSKKLVAIRGLNRNHNHDLKNIFKGAATRTAAVAGPFQEYYAASVARGMKPPMARLTLARKIAAITLLVWKKGARATPSRWLYEPETLSERLLAKRLDAALRISGTTCLGS